VRVIGDSYLDLVFRLPLAMGVDDLA